MSVGDADAVALLNREMQYHSSAEQIAARFESISAQAGNAILVAERDGVVVGWAHVRIVESLQNEPYAALVGLAVRRESRRQRIGAELIAACRGWAVERGHPDVRLP